MKHLPHHRLSDPHRRAYGLIAIAWMLIVVKCIFVIWAVEHWNLPFNAAWIVAPTLFSAGVITALWLNHENA